MLPPKAQITVDGVAPSRHAFHAPKAAKKQGA